MNKRLRLTIYITIILIVMYIILNYIEYHSMYIQTNSILSEFNDSVLLGGEACGIKLLATGVLVVGVEKDDIDIKIGDVILKVNDREIKTNKELIKIVNEIKDDDIKLYINRNDKYINVILNSEYDELSRGYKLRIMG